MFLLLPLLDSLHKVRIILDGILTLVITTLHLHGLDAFRVGYLLYPHFEAAADAADHDQKDDQSDEEAQGCMNVL